MSAGSAYTQRYAGGFLNRPTTSTPVDSTFLNAVETALAQLLGVAPSADGQVAQWDYANTRFGPALLLNKNVDPAAAIAYSKLNLAGGIVNADVNAAAAIAYSKLSLANQIKDADIASAAAIAISKLAGYPTDATKFARGDGTWAAPAMVQLYDSTLGVATASFDVSSISGAYNHLRLHLLIRGDTAAANTRFQMRFNNDTAGNYDWQRMFLAAAGPPGGQESFAATSLEVGDIPAATSTASLFGQGVIDIAAYAQTTAHKLEQFSGTSIEGPGTGTGNMVLWSSGGRWRSTAAINRITIFPAAGNFIAGSRLTIYGLL